MHKATELRDWVVPEQKVLVSVSAAVEKPTLPQHCSLRLQPRSAGKRRQNETLFTQGDVVEGEAHSKHVQCNNDIKVTWPSQSVKHQNNFSFVPKVDTK